MGFIGTMAERSDSLSALLYLSLKNFKDSGKHLRRHPHRALSIQTAAHQEVFGLILFVL